MDYLAIAVITIQQSKASLIVQLDYSFNDSFELSPTKEVIFEQAYTYTYYLSLHAKDYQAITILPIQKRVYGITAKYRVQREVERANFSKFTTPTGDIIKHTWLSKLDLSL